MYAGALAVPLIVGRAQARAEQIAFALCRRYRKSPATPFGRRG
jgi:hypothetical protein